MVLVLLAFSGRYVDSGFFGFPGFDVDMYERVCIL